MVPEVPFREGEILADKYRILRILGTGGMGMVFAAEHLDVGSQVALKVMLPAISGNEEAVARLLREARASGRLTSPHVAKVLDVGRLPSGVPYLVMELLEGQNLQQLIGEHGPLAVTDAVDYLLEACEALAEAHRAGIVHRDLKPGNLFLATDAYGERLVKLMDFGISKVISPDLGGDFGLTDTRTLLGSPVYMSPEQMRSARNVDHRTDMWSLGTILFELVTGRVAWSGESLSDICAQVVRDPAPSIRSVLADAPSELDTIVARCLEKNPAGRYQRVSDLALALAPFGSSRARVTLDRILRVSGGDEEQTSTQVPGQAGAHRPKTVPLAPPLRAPSAERADKAQTRATFQGTAATGRQRHPGRRWLRVLALLSLAVPLTAAVWLLFWHKALDKSPADHAAAEPPWAASAAQVGRHPAPSVDVSPASASAAVSSTLPDVHAWGEPGKPRAPHAVAGRNAAPKPALRAVPGQRTSSDRTASSEPAVAKPASTPQTVRTLPDPLSARR